MTVEQWTDLFLWSMVLNFGVLLIWFAFLTLMGDLVFRIHSKIFKISRESFHTIHYAGLTGFKLLVFLFNVVPYVALRIVA